MKNEPQNAILGIAFNYSDLILRPFLISLQNSGFKGDLILFTNNKTCLSNLIIYDFNIVFINIERRLSVTGLIHKLIKRISIIPYLQDIWVSFHRKIIRLRLEDKRPFSTWMLGFIFYNLHMTSARFGLYYDWVLRNKHENIFLTDVSDVVFQGDIFRNVVNSKVLAFEEYSDVRIGYDGNNRDWIETGYGSEVLNAMFESRICCAGTILCNRVLCIDFLVDFVMELLKRDNSLNMSGFDQGVFNYLLSYVKKDYFETSGNGKVVFTVASQPIAEIFTLEDILAPDNSHTPAVVHQYNRYRNLVEFIQNKYIS
jgi:hypothetical protein